MQLSRLPFLPDLATRPTQRQNDGGQRGCQSASHAASHAPRLCRFRVWPGLFCTVCTLVLAACGGGGGGDAALGSSSQVSPAAQNLPAISATAIPVPPSTYAPDSAQLGGWVILQQARGLCGFGQLAQNSALDSASQSHARYQTQAFVSAGTAELTHYETDTANPFYTGYAPWDRSTAAGYGDRVAEILEGTRWEYDLGNPPALPPLNERGANSMISLLNTVYHLMGAMYDGADVGFGADLQTLASGSTRHEEYRFGMLNGFQTQLLPLGLGQLATYPCAGSVNVPTTFAPAFETPNPFPVMTSPLQVLGPPIYLKADRPQVLRLSTSSIIGSNGVVVPSTVITHANDPAAELGSNELFVVPTTTLHAYTRYDIRLAGTLNGVAFERHFSILTGD